MVTAILLMRIERGRVAAVAGALLEHPAVNEAYSVAGPWDLVAVIRVKRHDELNELVTERLAKIDGIAETQTLVAFRCYSRKDVQAMWDLGLE
jgi:DNA-binding Lrp family transcriptional regulator